MKNDNTSLILIAVVFMTFMTLVQVSSFLSSGVKSPKAEASSASTVPINTAVTSDDDDCMCGRCSLNPMRQLDPTPCLGPFDDMFGDDDGW